jgi:hypothetical protein
MYGGVKPISLDSVATPRVCYPKFIVIVSRLQLSVTVGAVSRPCYFYLRSLTEILLPLERIAAIQHVAQRDCVQGPLNKRKFGMRLLTNLGHHSDQVRSKQAARSVARLCVRGRSVGTSGTLRNELIV